MFCDMIDGRLARFARLTSDFGAQLDSMCDVISFGIAPAILMVRTVMGAAHGQAETGFVFARFSGIGLERLLWCLGAVYVAGAAMRLARFNVENAPDESAHMEFRGLPSPGAAAAVATLVLLFVHLENITRGGWLFGPWLLSTTTRISEAMAAAIGVLLPLVTLATGLLMVSRFRYAHVVNQYIRGKRPFSYLVKVVVLGLLALLEPYLALAGAAVVYALSAPLAAAWVHFHRPPPAPASGPPGGAVNP
jgi:CDP-diacylglycerol--serine O-phosphatidyltransferase